MLRSPFHIHPITSPSPLENDNITTNSYTHSAIFLVEQYLGNQVGPVSTSIYSCHTHMHCPSFSIAGWSITSPIFCPSPSLVHNCRNFIKKYETVAPGSAFMFQSSLCINHIQKSYPSLRIYS